MTPALDTTRELVIHTAAREWEGSALTQSLCERRAYVNDALRQAGMPLIGKGDERRLTVHQAGDDAARVRVIREAVAEYQAADEKLRRAWNIADVVNGSLYAAGMEPLTDEELEELEAGRLPAMRTA